MKKKLLLMVAIIVMMLVPVLSPMTARAQNLESYKQQVRRYLETSQAIKKLAGQQFKYLPYGLQDGYIRVGAGNYQNAYYDLIEGYAYAFVGACDEDCRDLDFALYAPDGTKIAADTGNNDTPVIWLLAPRSGRYRLMATTPKCLAPIGCYWGVQALWK